jgi:parvulin-like peptidyl-prolyl isomerase
MKKLLAFLFIFSPSLAFSEAIMLDTIVATVNDKAITLQEIGRRLEPPRRLSLEHAGTDLEVRRALDAVILEKLVREEATRRDINVHQGEVEFYVDEVSALNNLSRAEFEAALAAQGKDFSQYRSLVELDILKSKLVSDLQEGGVQVTDEEIQEYLKLTPGLVRSGAKIQLSQILLAHSARTRSENEAIIAKIKKELKSNVSFSELAYRHSDGIEAELGGKLGIFSEEELNPMIFDAIFALENGEVSEVALSDQGFHIFRLDQRFVEKPESNAMLLSEIRKLLRERKVEQTLQSFFSRDLYENHLVEKKI